MRRQITYLGGFILIIIIIAIGLFLIYKPTADCFDNKQNQSEEGIDCGGVCTPCVVEPADPVVLWTKVFPLGRGPGEAFSGNKYEVAALVKNNNFNVGAERLKYTFKLYDQKNILVSAREGETYLNPLEEYLIFETDINTQERFPARAFIEFEDIKWKYTDKEKAEILISNKEFSNEPSPSLSVKITNKSLLDARNIELSASLFDAQDNVIGVSFTKISRLAAESSRLAYFTWQDPFEDVPTRIEILVRTDIVHEK